MKKEYKQWCQVALIMLWAIIAIAANSGAISYGCMPDPKTGSKETFYIVVAVINGIAQLALLIAAAIPIIRGDKPDKK